MKIVYGLLYAFVPTLSTLLAALFVSLVVALTTKSEAALVAIVLGPGIASLTYTITAIMFCIVKEPKSLLFHVSVISFICSLVLLILALLCFDSSSSRWI